MIDTHCHITKDYYDDIPFLLNKIKNSGVHKIIVNGCDMKSNLEVLELTKQYDIVYGALGFHPTELETITDDDLCWLEEHINNDKIVALGEIGIEIFVLNNKNICTPTGIHMFCNVNTIFIHLFSISLLLSQVRR